MTTQDLAETAGGFPLFELFSAEQLAWVLDRAKVVTVPDGTELFAIGDRPKSFWVLLAGELHIQREMDHRLVTIVSSSTPGAWAGLVPYVFDESQITARLGRTSRLLELAAEDVRHMVDVGFPIAKHLMLGVTTGTQRWSDRLAERERMMSLGRLSAGLAHELNNPASAVRRAASQLRRALAAHEAAALDVACAAPGPDLADSLAGMREQVAAAAAAAPALSPLDRAEHEDRVGAWLLEGGVDDGHDLAPTLVDAGLDTADLERLLPAHAPGPARVAMLRWLVASTESRSLLGEVEGAAARIADLVKAVKAYSYMDRADVSAVDVRGGLDDTLRMLKSKLAGVTVERDYDPELPTINGHGGQLNQVWTNLIDNAADALGGSGTLRLTATATGDGVVVTVQDDGPGIPEEIVRRVFEPFFTTKGVGQGTGLGLDIARRIVSDTAGGELSVESRPGRTVFRVALPATAPP